MPPENSTTKRAALVALALCLSLSGCVSIESNRDPSFDKRVGRIYVMMRGGDRAERFMNNLGGQIQQAFQKRGVRSEVYVVDPLSLEGESEVRERVSAFNPDAVLVVVQTEQSFYNGVSAGGRFELGLFELGSDKPVWKAKLNTDTGGYGMGSSEQVAEKIVARMVEDRLLRSASQEATVSSHRTAR